MLPVSLDCPLLIAPSVFSNVYSETSKLFIQIRLLAWKGKQVLPASPVEPPCLELSYDHSKQKRLFHKAVFIASDVTPGPLSEVVE
jgi:hypothetical protein